MERREKEAREASLKKLKRLRIEGKSYEKVSSEEDDDLNMHDILQVHSSDEEFIEYVPEPLSEAPSSVTQAPPMATFKDDFFNSLVQQLDQEPLTTDPVAEEIDWDEPLPEFPTISKAPLREIVVSELEPIGTNEHSEPVAENNMHSNEENIVLFYWIDAHERPNGTVFLFGRVQECPNGPVKSACLTVKSTLRNVFLLPRDTIEGTECPNTMDSVKQEVDLLMSKAGIQLTSIRRVTRKYAFDVPGLPTEADWIKLSYPFSQPQITVSSGKTFSHVFGSGTGALELLLIKRKIMGPCWLAINISSSAKKGVSWCPLEYEVSSLKSIVVMPEQPPSPSMVISSISIRTVLVNGHNEISSASGVLFDSYSLENSSSNPTATAAFSVVREDAIKGAISCNSLLAQYGTKGKLEVAKNEKSLLSFLLAIIYRWDPDVIVGHNFLGFDQSIILQRLKANNVSNWSKVGRLSWSHWPRMGRLGDATFSFQERQILSGRLVCDTFVGAREHLRSKNYELSTLVESQLGIQRQKDDPLPLTDAYSLIFSVKSAESDAFLQAQLAFRLQLLQLSKQLTNIAGNLWIKTLMGARAERNEYLFLHEFHNRKYIVPDKRSHKEVEVDLTMSDNEEETGSSRRKPQYMGGLVLEPKRGLYTNIIMLLDFNSLYPSIIQEYNICFTTVERSLNSDVIPPIPDPSLPIGVLPKILANLVQRRRQVKAMMKDSKCSSEERSQLNTRQQALKLTANSMYGCLGFTHSRFHARPLAALITSKGRELLAKTVELAEQQCGLNVIYGDTDSVMINSGLSSEDPSFMVEVKTLASKLKQLVNERYKYLEIELDGLFKRLLLLKKKKYAALIVQEDGTSKLETKGLDMVRRDWCPLSVEVCNFCLDLIMACSSGSFSTLSEQISKYLQALLINLQALQVPIAKFVISKNLTKDPSQYVDIKGQPHVAVALRMRSKGEAIQSGVTIPYIICKSSTSTLSERAFHPNEVANDPSLKIDYEWYIQQQVIPPVSRLCEFVPDVDGAFLAAALGQDVRKYSLVEDKENKMGSDRRKKELEFVGCKPLTFICESCQKSFDFNGIASAQLSCPLCNVSLTHLQVYHQVIKAVRKLQNEVFELQVFKCDECHNESSSVRIFSQRCLIDDCHGTTSGKAAYYQLMFWSRLFDLELARIGATVEDSLKQIIELHKLLEPCALLLEQRLNACNYPIINLRGLFSFWNQ